MVTYSGVIPAPTLQVAPCGLLSVASVTYNSSHEWLRGFHQETNAAVNLNLLTIDNSEPSNSAMSTVADGTKSFYSVTPFIIEVEAMSTGFDLQASNPLDGSLFDQISAASQKAAERELWEGIAARDVTPVGTGYLREEDGADILTSSGETAARALALLEQNISTSPTGARGVIHATRDVVSALGDRVKYISSPTDSAEAYAMTRLGTLIVVGSGYTGNGPINAAGAASSATNKWMYATGFVDVVFGEIEVTNRDNTDGFDPTINDSVMQAMRPAAASFDPSIWSTAQVTLG